MKIDNENNTVWVRQSWLGDVLLCPERARLGITMPSFRRGSEATAIGTGMHSAIEGVLTGAVEQNQVVMTAVAEEHVFAELAKPDIARVDYSDEEVVGFVHAMTDAWYNNIQPEVEFGGQCERQFSVLTDLTVGPYKLGFSGTMDYVTPSGVIWDWKTAARKYFANEKQKQSVQASVYGYAVNQFMPEVGYPVDFRFGVMLRHKNPTAQILKITRSKEQINWLLKQTSGIVSQHLNTGLNTEWTMNDQHFLCSAKWCSYWSVCKGAYVAHSDGFPPAQ